MSNNFRQNFLSLFWRRFKPPPIIPEQMVYRDTSSLQFTFTGLFFSETAAYSNN